MRVLETQNQNLGTIIYHLQKDNAELKALLKDLIKSNQSTSKELAEVKNRVRAIQRSIAPTFIALPLTSNFDDSKQDQLVICRLLQLINIIELKYFNNCHQLATLNRDVKEKAVTEENQKKYFRKNFPNLLFGKGKKEIRGHAIFEALKGKHVFVFM